MSEHDVSFWQNIAWRLEAAAYDAFVGFMRLLPLDFASDVGGWLLRVLGPLVPIQRTVSRNLDLAFPEKDAEWKARISREQWDNLGRTFAEFAQMDRITIESGRVVVDHMERLTDIAAAGKPVVLISGHFANFEVMAAVIVAAGIPCQVTYRAANNPYIDERIRAGRQRYGVQLFAPKGGDGAKELMIGMARGESVALLNDQKFNRGIATPFFSHPVDTAPGPTRLALRFNTILQPLTVERLHKARFRVVAHPPISVVQAASRAEAIEATVCNISRFIEGVVRERPQEWFWVHKRWPNELYRRKST
ncbi:lysophospholipid acyltransferase family protein [Asticcacaulis sp. EMRT-3]|uniref:lysophospholipid acyltransferase family protein n=1 Tax=Asticcacaulis sp. EMRT-3 TaxID=3040349 RepID=UPI0024AEE465|nr:lysophospholipid acyltransferase family protein [Asticcacaulis sp. EMRT-3]MDI7774482.1 lysophospholipid acyltransferase family protein [Asticcacaulis sp. EMRT-3]